MQRSGKWLGDLWACCVSAVVGPPYAVLGVSPPYGPMTGGTQISLKGAGFSAGSICVRFSAGDFSADVPGTFVSSTEIRAVTPNVKAAIGERRYLSSFSPYFTLRCENFQGHFLPETQQTSIFIEKEVNYF